MKKEKIEKKLKSKAIKKYNIPLLCASCVMVLFVTVCVGTRIVSLSGVDMYKTNAGQVGNVSLNQKTILSEAEKSEVELKKSETADKQEKSTEEADNSDSTGEERKFPVIESQIGGTGLSYNNFYVKNSTNYTFSIENMLNKKLGFEMEDTTKPQVLIVHTHATEAYLETDEGFYYENYETRSTENKKNITMVGQAIKKQLEAKGIAAVHDTTQHDNPSYQGSYDRSVQTINKYLEEYPSIKVVLDIHRDSIGNGGSSGKIKPTFIAEGKKAAQIMIMTGYDEDGSYNFPHWDENLTFALKLQEKCETMYPGMTRPLNFGDFVYNMNVNNGSLLIEIGTDMNTLEEAVYTGELLANALSGVLS